MPAFLLPLALGAAGLTGAGLTWWGTRSANNQTKQNYNQDQLDFEQQLQLQDRDFANSVKLAELNQGFSQEQMNSQLGVLQQLEDVKWKQRVAEFNMMQPFADQKMRYEGQNALDQIKLQNAGLLERAGLEFDLGKLQDATQRYGIDKEFELGELQDATQRYGIDKQLEGVDLQSRRQLEAALDTNATTKYGYDLNHDAALKELARLRDADKFNLYANLFNGLGNFAFRG